MFKNINETKGLPAATREWKDSVYSYNENTVKGAPHNDSMANTIVNMVLHLTPHKKVNTKSKRMRDLIRRNTTRQLIVSKPDIKQTSDKAIVTVYIFDREKAMYTRKLFFIKNSLDKSTISKNVTSNNNKKLNSISSISSFVNSMDSNSLLSLNDNYQTTSIDKNAVNLSLIKLKNKLARNIKKHNPNKRLKMRLKRLFTRKLSYKHKIDSKILTRVLYKSFMNNKSTLNNLFMLKFLKWLLSYFNLSVSYYKAGKILNILNAQGMIRATKIKNNMLILANNINSTFDSINRAKDSGETYDLDKYTKLYRIPNITPLLQVRLINKLLLTHIRTMMVYYIDDIVRTNTGIRKMFDLYRNKYMMSHAMFYLRKQKLTLSYLVKLYNNKLKYTNIIHGFKWLLGNIFSKNIKLNLVNLKYLHLNSDIFSESVSIKLRKKNNRLLKILKKALKLVKLPKINSHNSEIQKITKVRLDEFDWSDVKSDLNKGYILKTKSSASPNDMLDSLLYNMFPNEINYDKHQLAHNIIYSIRHKWVRGARLEAKGRLTKRYTASRSLFKFRYKGSLRNLEYLKKPNFTREQVSVFMLRNSIRPNVQHTFTTSRKRIGVYGIKGWISGY